MLVVFWLIIYYLIIVQSIIPQCQMQHVELTTIVSFAGYLPCGHITMVYIYIIHKVNLIFKAKLKDSAEIGTNSHFFSRVIAKSVTWRVGWQLPPFCLDHRTLEYMHLLLWTRCFTQSSYKCATHSSRLHTL